MAEITAALVKAFRDKTGLPMMDCKKALAEADGDAEKALTILREKGKLKMIEKGAERTTEEGVLATAANENGVAMIELLCESAPVAGNPEFLQLAQDIANVYLEKGGQTAEEVMGNASPSKEGMTLQEQMEELYNRIREVFRLNRFTRLEGNGAAYVHHNKKVGVIIATEGKNEEAAKDVCMHAAAMHPEYLNRDQIPAEVIAKEREIQLAAMANDPKNAGKPESILNKIIDGKINAFFKANCLVDQEFVKDSSLSVGAYAKNNGIDVTQYVNWTLGAK
ncbi:MAG: translation elongation factor Ts [Thermoguttaceae bacterium]|nr:translation elongation factor Ts [Thermoguttaceae bacterium]MBQ6615905.1 translation elongation factor Ts [Thermoguttaceae bacterium]